MTRLDSTVIDVDIILINLKNLIIADICLSDRYLTDKSEPFVLQGFNVT